MTLTVGSTFSGVGALDLAVIDVLAAELVWHCENDSDAARVLHHHWPHLPNLGDITQVRWRTVAPVDVLTAGFPCQDVSSAGRRLGLRPGTRSGLWQHMAYAIAQLHPSLVVIENVRGLLSAPASSDVEPCPWCLGDTDDGRALRALGAVLGDLAALGFDAEWVGLRAADVGACHARFRIMVLAWPAATADTGGEAVALRTGLRPDGAGRLGGRRPDDVAVAAPADTDRAGREGAEPAGRRLVSARGAEPDGGTVDWGGYRAAVERWGHVIGRGAPDPFLTGSLGGQQLNPGFVEWMQGLPPGWVTGVPGYPPDALLPGLPAEVTGAPGLTRAAMLRLLGNTVVPQWAAAALRRCLAAAPPGVLGGVSV